MTWPDEHLAARRILSVTEEELQRIILDIHDGPVQKLFAALSQLSALETRMTYDDAPEAWLVDLARVSGLIEASLGEVRSSLGTWRPPGFSRRDLVSMLEGLIIQHEEFTDCRVEWDVLGVVRVQGATLDVAYLRTWAGPLGVADLLDIVLAGGAKP